MKEGRAPLRTFGDLKQFIELKSSDAAPDTNQHATPPETPVPDDCTPPDRARDDRPRRALGPVTPSAALAAKPLEIVIFPPGFTFALRRT